MGEAAFEGVGGVGEVGLDPLDVGEAWAVGVFVDHAGGEEVEDIGQGIWFRHGLSLGVATVGQGRPTKRPRPKWQP